MSGDLNETGEADGARPTAGAPSRKPWVRPSYELAGLDETEVGPANGPDLNTSVS